jgi:hypothetical protein
MEEIKKITIKELQKQEAKYKKFAFAERKKKYFNLEAINKHFGKFNFYMILGKKNIGKTYFYINLMRKMDTESNQDKILYCRLEQKELLTLRNEWNYNKLYPFYISGMNIFSKNFKDHKPLCKKNKSCKCKDRHKGVIAFLGNLGAERGSQYIDYKFVMIDEFINETGTYRGEETLTRQFINFASNVNREKKKGKLTFFMFGNNNSMINPYLGYFNVAHDINILIYKKIPFIYLNLRGLYGVKNSLISELASFKQNIKDYIHNNANFDNNNMLVKFKERDKFILRVKFIFEKFGFHLLYLNDVKDNYIYALSVKYNSEVNFDYTKEPYYSVNNFDNLNYNNVVIINKSN